MTRFLVLIAALSVLYLAPVITHASGDNIGACAPMQVRLGGEGGGAFTAVAPNTIRLRSGSFVDNLILNGKSHGGSGGGASTTLTLQPGEYVNRMVVRHGSFVDRLEFYTSSGRSLAGGGGGGSATVLENIRVLTLGGRSGTYLDQIEITYCANYLP